MPCLKLIKPKNARYHNGYKATQMSMRPVYRTFSPMGLALQKGWAQILAKSCCVFYLKGDVFKKHKSQNLRYVLPTWKFFLLQYYAVLVFKHSDWLE